MAEDNKIVLASNEPSLGEVRIAPEVIEVIIGIAANKVEGVYSMRGSVTKKQSTLVRAISKRNFSTLSFIFTTSF